MITYFLCEQQNNALNGEVRNAMLGNRPNQPSNYMQPSQQQQATPHQPHPAEYYQKQSHINEKNYHPNMINTESYNIKKDNFNYLGNPNILLKAPSSHHDDHRYKFKQNYNREMLNLRENNHNYFKRDHYNTNNYHHNHQQSLRDNFNITENPNIMNNHESYNIRESYGQMESYNNISRRDQLNVRNHFNNNYSSCRENEPLLHPGPVAKVSFVLYAYH